MKNVFKLIALPLAALAFSTSAYAADRNCQGNLGKISVKDNLIVQKGKECKLNGTKLRAISKLKKGLNCRLRVLELTAIFKQNNRPKLKWIKAE